MSFLVLSRTSLTYLILIYSYYQWETNVYTSVITATVNTAEVYIAGSPHAVIRREGNLVKKKGSEVSTLLLHTSEA